MCLKIDQQLKYCSNVILTKQAYLFRPYFLKREKPDLSCGIPQPPGLKTSSIMYLLSPGYLRRQVSNYLKTYSFVKNSNRIRNASTSDVTLVRCGKQQWPTRGLGPKFYWAVNQAGCVCPCFWIHFHTILSQNQDGIKEISEFQKKETNWNLDLTPFMLEINNELLQTVS